MCKTFLEKTQLANYYVCWGHVKQKEDRVASGPYRAGPKKMVEKLILIRQKTTCICMKIMTSTSASADKSTFPGS